MIKTKWTFIQKTLTKPKSKFAVKINTGTEPGGPGDIIAGPSDSFRAWTLNTSQTCTQTVKQHRGVPECVNIVFMHPFVLLCLFI